MLRFLFSSHALCRLQAGSLLGQVYSSYNSDNSSDSYEDMAEYNGMAPQAKMAFYDLKKIHSDEV